MRRPIGTIYVNGTEVETFIFYGGECHVKLKPDNILGVKKADIIAYIYSSDDLMCLLLTVDALRQLNPIITINLGIPYFPYARQDRVCVPGEAFSLRVMAQLIAGLKVDHLSIVDPHSLVTSSLLGEIRSLFVVDLLQIFLDHELNRRFESTILVAPDAGAERKVTELGDYLKKKVVCCWKTRDPETGQITGMEVPDVIDKKSHYLVVDDICDGGRTFIELAKKFQEKGILKSQLHLYVTHGIFSKGLASLFEHYSSVTCYHIFPEVETKPWRGYDLTTLKGDDQ